MARARNDSPLAGTAPSAGGEVSKLSIAMFLFRTTLFRALVPQSTRLCQYCDIVGPVRNRDIAPSLAGRRRGRRADRGERSEEHTSELQSLMRISYAVFCLKKKTIIHKMRYNPPK